MLCLLNQRLSVSWIRTSVNCFASFYSEPVPVHRQVSWRNRLVRVLRTLCNFNYTIVLNARRSHCLSVETSTLTTLHAPYSQYLLVYTKSNATALNPLSPSPYSGVPCASMTVEMHTSVMLSNCNFGKLSVVWLACKQVESTCSKLDKTQLLAQGTQSVGKKMCCVIEWLKHYIT